jgi:hypothetical protein
MLTHSFMVLFRAANVGALGVEMHAILTPSTKGLRENIASQGISFTMPLMPKTSSAAGSAVNLAEETSNSEKNSKINSAKEPLTEKLNDSNSNSVSNEIKSSGNLF